MADPAIVVRAAGAVATRDGGIPARRVVAALAYEPAEQVGFQRLPAHLIEALRDRGILSGEELAANAERPVTKCRANGSCYQLIEAWWASDSRYVWVDARRELATVSGGKFKPVTQWALTGTVSTFPASSRRTVSQWRRAAGDSAGPCGPSVRTHDPLDTLPAQVAAPVRGGRCGAWRFYSTETTTEVIVASLADGERVRVLRAWRQAESLRLLDYAGWQTETLDLPVVAHFSIGPTLRTPRATRAETPPRPLQITHKARPKP